MKNELKTITIHNKTCHVYKNGSQNRTVNRKNRLPIFYWGIGEGDKESVETVASYIEEHIPDTDFLLAAYESDNWNDDFSPWAAPAVFGKEGFGGKADSTLRWLVEYCMPYIEAEAPEIARFSVGYSLAGLFSLWVYCECESFAGAVSCSGSLWYDGWIAYVQKRAAQVHQKESNYIYLSLGDKEEKTKNKRMATVGGNTKKVYTMLCENKENVSGILEWNQGGHFTEPDLRIAKGIDWILQQFGV